jgi:predicted RNase H-like nuclease
VNSEILPPQPLRIKLVVKRLGTSIADELRELFSERPLRTREGERDVVLVAGAPPELICAADDIVDAFVALWTAERIERSEAVSIPALPPVDVHSIRMEMVA